MLPETFTKPFRKITLIKKNSYYYTKTVTVQMFTSKKSALAFKHHMQELWGERVKPVFPKGVKPRPKE